MFVLGIDVSKDKLDCYLGSEVEEKPRHKCMFQVENTAEGFENLDQWLAQASIPLEEVTVVLEPTNTYHVELAYWLHSQMATVCLANPKDVHHYAKSLGRDSKTDRLDCFALAMFGQTRKLHTWTPPSATIRKLDALIRMRSRIVQDRVREENRLQVLPREERLQVGEYSKELIKLLKEQETRIMAKIKALIAQDDALQTASRKLRSIPGIGLVSTALLLVLFSNREFRNGEQAAAFCGLIPKEYQSGSSVQGKPRMTKRGPVHIRAVMRMAAQAVLTTKKPSALKAYYERLLERGKPKACALGALAHKLVVVAFAIWREKADYKIEATSENNPAQQIQQAQRSVPRRGGACCICEQGSKA